MGIYDRPEKLTTAVQDAGREIRDALANVTEAAEHACRSVNDRIALHGTTAICTALGINVTALSAGYGQLKATAERRSNITVPAMLTNAAPPPAE